jgi:CheY-like chemotaxis protein
VAKREKPDLMTLDITMPGKSGSEVYAAIRKDKDIKSLPVCIITGNPELRKLIYDRHVTKPDGYVDKPITEEGLLVNVRKILDLKAEGKKAEVSN